MTALPPPLPPPEHGTRQLDAPWNFFYDEGWPIIAVATVPSPTISATATAYLPEQPPLNVRALFVFLIFGFWCWVGVVVGVIMGLFLAHPPSPVTHPTPYVGSDNLGRGLLAFLLLAGVCAITVLVGYSAKHEEPGAADDSH